MRSGAGMRWLGRGLFVGNAALAVQSWHSFGLMCAAAPSLARRQRPATPTFPADAPRVAVVIPAHDEEIMVGRVVESVLGAEYPEDRLACIVIADNCADDTAARARDAGAEVWERQDLLRRSKGYALEWAFARLLATRPETDAILVVDADCLLPSDALLHIGKALANGADAVQTDCVVSNPEASPTAALRAAAFSLVMGVRPVGKEALGLSVGLFGTGMAFTTETLRAAPWDASSLTEDTEYQIRLVAAGKRVRFLKDTQVTTPMPVNASQARSQEERWEGGRIHLARTVGPRLALQAVRTRDWRLLESLTDAYALPQSLLMPSTLAATALAVAFRARSAAVVGMSGILTQVLYVVGSLILVRAPRSVWVGLLHAPKLMLRKVALKARLAVSGIPTEFVRTDRAQH